MISFRTSNVQLEMTREMETSGLIVDRRMESQYKEILGGIEVEGTVMNPDSDARHKWKTYWEAATFITERVTIYLFRFF